jgi:hypothetical protein
MMTEADRSPERDIELDAILTTYGFLLEMAFSSICQLHPEGEREALRRIRASLQGMLERSPANPDAMTARDVKVSDEAERQLRIFLERLSSRIL